VADTEKAIRLFFFRPPVDESQWLLARSECDAEDGCELPDGLEKLYAIVSNAMFLVRCTARPFLEACHNDREDPHPLLTDLGRFKDDLWCLNILCIEGWRLLRDYEVALISAASGAVSACGIVGTSAHEAALRLADRVVCKIVGSREGSLFSRRFERANPESLKSYLHGLKTRRFKTEVVSIPTRTGFLDQDELNVLEEQLRSEYIIASSQVNVSPLLPTAESSELDTPCWDSERRELRFHGRICKRFRQPAPNQTRVLDAFQEAGWPAKIDDPIPPQGDLDHRQRLADAVRGLNKNHGIRFELDGTGEGILWRPAANEVP